jgi:hypothetical protein
MALFLACTWPIGFVSVVAQSTGSTSGNIALPGLTRQTDSTWFVKFTPLRQETITVRLSVDGALAAQQTLVVTGTSPAALDLRAGMRQASFTSQAGSVTAQVMNGSSLLAFTGESSFLTVPIVDKAGAL